jgi:hypothetical protein
MHWPGTNRITVDLSPGMQSAWSCARVLDQDYTVEYYFERFHLIRYGDFRATH